MPIMPLLETPTGSKFNTLLPMANPLWSITYRQLTYVHTFFFFSSRSVCILPDCGCTQGVSNGVPAPSDAMPDIAEPFSRNVPNYDSRTSAMEDDLKRLAVRYLHNPDSRVDTLRMGLSPSGGRFMVMILLEVDDLI
jgi:hypothetical protein